MARSRAIWAGMILLTSGWMVVGAAGGPGTPTQAQTYCSGIVTKKAPAEEGEVVSGEQAADKLQFSAEDLVYVRLRAVAARAAGTEYLVVRRTKDATAIEWFHGEGRLRRKMGRLWEDVGRVRLVKSGDKMATARIEMSCMGMERGDRLVAMEQRATPELPEAKPARLELATSERVAGRVVMAKGFRQELGAGDVAYVDLGAAEGMRVGERVRLYHYPGREQREAYSTPGTATAVEGFGHAPGGIQAKDLPEEVVGEGVVLRVSPTAATVLITYSRAEIDLGDFVQPE